MRRAGCWRKDPAMTSRPLIAFSLTALAALTVALLARGQGPEAAPMRPAKAIERAAAINSIQAQLKAFRKDDYKTAVTYQSAGLRKNFASPEAFRAMMLRVYPEFAHFKSVRFSAAQCDPSGVHLAIPAAVTGQDGVTIHALYLMVREGKVYHVEGVAGGAQAPMDNAVDVPGRDV